MSETQKTKLKVQGMHCSSCALLIDSDLEDLEGVARANTSYVRQETTVEFDPQVLDLAKISKTIENTGYKAEIITS